MTIFGEELINEYGESVAYDLGWLKDEANSLLSEQNRLCPRNPDHWHGRRGEGVSRVYIPPGHSPGWMIVMSIDEAGPVHVRNIGRRVRDNLYTVFYNTPDALGTHVDIPSEIVK